MENKFDEIEKLIKQVKECNNINNFYYEGNLKSNILFVNSISINKNNKFYKTKISKLFNNAINIIGYKIDDVCLITFIENKEDFNNQKNHVTEKIENDNCNKIIVLGNYSKNLIFNNEYKVEDIRGNLINEDKLSYIVTWNLLELLNDQNKKEDFIYDLKKILD